jgi:hypothetical protein
MGMQDLIISLNGNVLKVTTLKDGNFRFVVKDVPHTAVKDSKILDVEAFSKVLDDACTEITSGSKIKPRLNFVLEPDEVTFRFITISKNSEDLEAKILAEIQSKLEDERLNDMYFSYIKIAPFVYQFVGIQKDLLDKYLEISTSLNFDLHSVLPWTMLLPKYVGTSNSSIFVCGIGKTPVVVLSELGGVFFVGTYDESQDPAKLYKLVQELSVYKRSKPIDKVYTFNYPHLTDAEGFSVHKVEIPNSAGENTAGFEVNLLANYMLDLAPDTVTSQSNLLNLLPLPVVEHKQMSLATVAAPLSAIVLVGALFGGYSFMQRNKTTPQPTGQVLSETKVQETTQSTSSANNNAPQAELKRSDLVIRVENGSGATGIAAKTKDVLEGLGYKVISIDTANENRESTLYKFKTSKLAFKDLVTADLKDKFPSTAVEEGIDTSMEYDLLIIVGTSEKL